MQRRRSEVHRTRRARATPRLPPDAARAPPRSQQPLMLNFYNTYDLGYYESGIKPLDAFRGRRHWRQPLNMNKNENNFQGDYLRTGARAVSLKSRPPTRKLWELGVLNPHRNGS